MYKAGLLALTQNHFLISILAQKYIYTNSTSLDSLNNYYTVHCYPWYTHKTSSYWTSNYKTSSYRTTSYQRSRLPNVHLLITWPMPRATILTQNPYQSIIIIHAVNTHVHMIIDPITQASTLLDWMPVNPEKCWISPVGQPSLGPGLP